MALSRAAGADPLLVQAGGGNASVKTADGRDLLVKASGCRLAELDATRGHVSLALGALLEVVHDPGLAALGGQAQQQQSAARMAALARGAGRPSLETGFHALLGRVVLHTHPVHVNAVTCRVDGPALAREVLAGIDHAWVPYAPPGHALALEVARVVARAPARVLLLESHGLIVSGATVDEVLALTRQVDGRCRARFDVQAQGRAPDRATGARLLAAIGDTDAAGRRLTAALLDDELLTAAATDLRGGPVCPDDVVYCGATPLALTPGELTDLDAAAATVRAHLGRATAPKAIVTAPGVGVVGVAPDPAALEPFAAQLRAHAAIVVRVKAAGGRLRRLDAAQVAFIDGMEGEAYRRRSLAAEGGTC